VFFLFFPTPTQLWIGLLNPTLARCRSPRAASSRCCHRPLLLFHTLRTPSRDPSKALPFRSFCGKRQVGVLFSASRRGCLIPPLFFFDFLVSFLHGSGTNHRSRENGYPPCLPSRNEAFHVFFFLSCCSPCRQCFDSLSFTRL